MKLELSDRDVLFIYGNFQKRIAEIDRISASPECPYDKTTIANQKAPYLSVIEKLSSQIPNLKKADNYF